MVTVVKIPLPVQDTKTPAIADRQNGFLRPKEIAITTTTTKAKDPPSCNEGNQEVANPILSILNQTVNSSLASEIGHRIQNIIKTVNYRPASEIWAIKMDKRQRRIG